VRTKLIRDFASLITLHSANHFRYIPCMAKKIFDTFFALIGIVVLGTVVVLFFLAIYATTGKSGLFSQIRIGQYGRKFTIFKLRTMECLDGEMRVTKLGRFLRKYKIDELPQLYNVLIGDMSFVGPRPDLPGYYDALQGTDRELLKLKPGLTGPASLKYSREEELLANVDNPVYYNDNILFPDKVRINLNYQKHRTFWLDISLIFYTVIGKQPNQEHLR
jgi:lipopolysaccharide/colanic/teichoic acid biosynthesis glycosyltransferase